MTLPFCGFSLAVSGRTMPLAVVSSSSIGLTISRSPRGFSFIRIPPLVGSEVRTGFGTLLWRVPNPVRTSDPTNGGIRMKLKPLGDRLIVKPIEEEETTASGIVLPDTAKEKPQKGKVIAVGDGAIQEDGSRRPLDLSDGDEVLY